MIIHIDGRTREITLISIPRDLYFKGRKVNSYYQFFGPDRLLKVISDITGMRIERYINIDMYAFMDVVNILGGIDVTLAEDLIDPTYRVRNDGVWSTLYYQKGTHHVNGIEALRVARARHFTPLLSRDDRQQRIIQGIKDKFDELTVRDLNKLYNIMQVLFQYVQTNLTPMEVIDIYRTYRELPITRRTVLSTSNILYDSYSNVYLLNDGAEKLSDDFDKGAWILLPLENDWSLIPEFIKQVLKGEIDG